MSRLPVLSAVKVTKVPRVFGGRDDYVGRSKTL